MAQEDPARPTGQKVERTRLSELDARIKANNQKIAEQDARAKEIVSQHGPELQNTMAKMFGIEDVEQQKTALNILANQLAEKKLQPQQLDIETKHRRIKEALDKAEEIHALKKLEPEPERGEAVNTFDYRGRSARKPGHYDELKQGQGRAGDDDPVSTPSKQNSTDRDKKDAEHNLTSNREIGDAGSSRLQKLQQKLEKGQNSPIRDAWRSAARSTTGHSNSR